MRILVVGNGPAGIAAALHLARQGLALRLVGEGPVGGLLHAARRLDNLPGYPEPLSGPELARRMEDQLRRRGIGVRPAGIRTVRRGETGLEALDHQGGIESASAVILATGTRPVDLDADWSALHPHRGVETLAPDLAGQSWLVAGGGDAAADTALSIRDRGGHPTLLLRGSKPRWHRGLATELERCRIPVKTRVTTPVTPAGAGPGMRLVTESVTLEAVGLVCCFGRIPWLPECPGLGPDDGVFPAGDADGSPLRYVARAMASGIAAAERAGDWLREHGGTDA